MAKQFFLDTNVLYDHYANRQPFAKTVSPLINEGLLRQYQFYTSSSCVSTCIYLLHNTDKLSIDKQKTILTDIGSLFRFIEGNNEVYIKTAKSSFKDLEDGILYFTADQGNIDYLITRNTKDFIREGFTQIINPQEALEIIQSKKEF
jgi:predicted nucleic acid-binding protein